MNIVHSRVTFNTDPQAVAQFRLDMSANGHKAVRVRSNGKEPVAHGWQHWEDVDALANVTADALNTGLLCAGLRAIDVDIDDPALAARVRSLAIEHLGAGSPVRFRANSPRVTMLYRAAEGAPKKRVLKGTAYKIEVLGDGQQFVVAGLHPSGAVFEWEGERSPANVPLGDLPAVTEGQIDSLLAACAPLLGAWQASATGNVLRFERAFEVLQEDGTPAPMSSVFADDEPDNDLGAGISLGPFDDLTAAGKSAALRDWLDRIDNTVADERDRWRNVLFACADGERQGCADARELALQWSKRGKKWEDEATFVEAWNSFKHKPGGIGVGSLAHMAKEAANKSGDLNYDPWAVGKAVSAATAIGTGGMLVAPGNPADDLNAISAGRVAGTGAVPAHGLSVGPTSRYSPCARSATNLPAKIPHRQWLHGIDLARGAVTLITAPGGRGKSTWMLTMALACATGCSLLGKTVFGGPLRVLYINSEDATVEIERKLLASVSHHKLGNLSLAGLTYMGADLFQSALLKGDGKQAEIDQAGWNAMVAEIDSAAADVVMLDPLVALAGGANLNDNAAASLLMRRLTALAAEKSIAVAMAHHVRKGADATNAEAAMGAASLTNLARICLTIEPLSEDDAGKVGVTVMDAKSVFRIVNTKANLSAPTTEDRFFHLVSNTLLNAEPPIYQYGDDVGVVEHFNPGAASGYSQTLLDMALDVIAKAQPPLTYARQSGDRYAIPAIAQAIASYCNGHDPKAVTKGVVEELLRTGRARMEDISIERPDGKGKRTAKGLVVKAPTVSPPHIFQPGAPVSSHGYPTVPTV